MKTFNDQYVNNIKRKFGKKHDLSSNEHSNTNFTKEHYMRVYSGLGSIITNGKNLSILDYGCGDGLRLKKVKNIFP